jgi:hypothetical protein
MNDSRPNVRRRTRSGSASGRRIAIAGLAGALLFGCNLDGGEPEIASALQPRPVATTGDRPNAHANASPGVPAGEQSPVSAVPTPEPKPDRPAEIDQLRDENRQLMQALDVTLANQQDLANQLRKTNEALAEIRSDVALVRERLRDLELAQDSHPLPQRAPAGPAAGVAQQR